MSKKILRLQNTDNAKELERYFEDSDIGKYDLRLPSKIKWGGYVGQSASIAQFVATWADKCEKPSLQLKEYNSEELIPLISRLYGLSSVYFSDQVWLDQSNKNYRYDMLSKAAPRFIAMWKRDYQNVSRGRSIELISVVGAKREFLPALYSDQPTIEDLLDRERHGQLISSSLEMASLFSECIKCINVPHHRKRLISKLKNKELIGELLYEAFRNTAEHAYLKENGEIPRKGLRCVLFNIISIEKTRIQECSPLSFERSEAIQYFNTVSRLKREREFPRKKIDFLEISILDSGPGFAATMRQFSPDSDEKTLVARCFEKHQSRKIGGDSGLGLYRILSAVNELNGFIRVRTSTCEASFFALRNSVDRSFLQPKIREQLAVVVGTLVTVSIPIAY